MRLKHLMNSLLPRLAKVPHKCSDHTKAVIARRVVQRYARGSTSLALGLYMTAADLNERKQRLALHPFDEAGV